MTPETSAGIITPGIEFERLSEALRIAQEAAANLCHLERASHGTTPKSDQWLHMSDLFKQIQEKVTLIATGRSS